MVVRASWQKSQPADSVNDQGQICGVQEYERSFFGIVIEPLSEREYDEFGMYEEWKRITGKKKCNHQFALVSEVGLSKSLEELKNKRPLTNDH